MDKKTQIHENIMDFLDDYLKNTSKDIIQQEMEAISKKKFPGVSAVNYFKIFDRYSFDEQTNELATIEKSITPNKKNDIEISVVFQNNININVYFFKPEMLKLELLKLENLNINFNDISSFKKQKKQLQYVKEIQKLS